MAPVSTRKPTTRKPQTLAQQLTCAMQRARTAKIVLVCIGFDDHGFRAEVTSERDPHTAYTITRDPQTHDMVCTCPATVVCKHIGRVLMEGTSYHSNAIPAHALPATANPNRPDPEPEPPAPSVAPARRGEDTAIASVLQTMPYQQRCERCGQYWHVKTIAEHYICPTCKRNDREQLEDYWRDFSLLMDVEAEVAIVEAEMDLVGFCWSAEARTWVRKPTMAQRASAALPANRTPETFASLRR